MQKKYKPSIFLLAIFLGGCGLLGPSYDRPNTDTPSNWVSKDSLSKDNNTTNLPESAWWQSFNDPVLSGLIVDALKYNNNIQQAVGNVIAAKGALQQVQMGWVPTLGGEAGYTSSQSLGGTGSAPPSLGAGGATSGSISSGEGYGTGLMPGYTINIFQQIKQQEQFKANYLAAEYTKDAMRLTIISQVAGSYFTLINQAYLLKQQQQLVLDTQKQWELGKDQYTEGYISLLAVQDYQQQYYNAKAQLPVIQNNIVQSENALRLLIGKNPGSINKSLDFVSIKTDGIIPVDMPSKVLENRPDIKAAEEQLIAANANIGVARANFFPTLSLTGTLGSASSGLANLFSSGSNYWQSQVEATMPVLNLSYFGTIKQARGQYYAAYYNYIFTVESAFQQVDNGLSAHQKLTDSYKTQTLVYDSAKLAYKLGDARFNEGADSYTKALEYKIKMDNSAITWAKSKLQQLQSIVNLYQALAGGYNVDNHYKSDKV